MVAHGELWWAEIPEAGRRPLLVLTRQTAIPVLHSLLVVPATRTIRGIPSEVVLDKSDGMPTECALSFDSLDRIDKTFFRDRITKLSSERMQEVCRALAIASGCA